MSNSQSAPGPVSGWDGFLRVVRSKHFGPFKCYVDRDHCTVVILNPKVGTKSLRQGLTDGLREIRGMKDPSSGRYWFLHNARRFPFAPLRDYAHAFRFPDQYRFYCFVRNPYARLRSAWLNKFAYGHVQGYSRSIRRRELGRLRRFASSAGLAGGRDGDAIPFETFLAYVESQPSGRRDHHWDDQHHVLLMDLVRYERCFRMEGEFAPGMRLVFERVGLGGPIMEHILAKPRGVGPKSPGPVYTPEIAARVQQLYARDFEVLGYDVESWRGL
jgi:hypothetical protein